MSADTERNVAICIGVSSAKSLTYVPATVNGARGFHAWARALGYESTLVVDDPDPVTAAVLKSAFENALATAPIHRLLIYFAGHGLIREAEEGLWLLSDWKRTGRAVAVEHLKRRLRDYGVQQIGIFADACRSLPPDMDAMDLVADPIIDPGPRPSTKAPPLDKFIAAQDGTRSFAVPGDTPEGDRCLFSGVLLEALWGTCAGAFSKVVKDRITSRSLGTYVQERVESMAKRYESPLVPAIHPGFPEQQDVYFGYLTPAPTPPSFPAWPATLPGLAGDVRGALQMRNIELSDFSKRGDKLAEALVNQNVPTFLESGSGFALDGEEIASVWTPGNLQAQPHDRPGCWQVAALQPSMALVEYKNGLFAAFAVLPQFIAAIISDKRGVSGLTYRRNGSSPETISAARWAITQMEQNNLRWNSAVDLATSLRQDKHLDPVLGVISAYLYDGIGDIDSIRRMAYYYVCHGQPIPYDIALLAQLQGQRNNHGVFEAHVQPVPAGAPRTQAEEKFPWTHAETHECSGIVGGLWPWMRQGWALLDEAAGSESGLILPGISSLLPHLQSARFTTFDTTGGRKLAEQLGLRQP